MDSTIERNYRDEEQIVAELAVLGIGYLSGSNELHAERIRPPQQLLADLVRQPSSRVRTSIIPLLLAHPEYAEFIPAAHSRLHGLSRILLELFYTAAVFLQRQHHTNLRVIQGSSFKVLPDLFSTQLAIPDNLPVSKSLARLAQRQQELTGVVANWAGTYENAFRHWKKTKETEIEWNR